MKTNEQLHEMILELADTMLVDMPIDLETVLNYKLNQFLEKHDK